VSERTSSDGERDGERMARLEADVAELRREVSEIKDQLERFRKQFE
jgi:predicted ATP-grasp superfamily ATP-dependent carboligase